MVGVVDRASSVGVDGMRGIYWGEVAPGNDEASLSGWDHSSHDSGPTGHAAPAGTCQMPFPSGHLGAGLARKSRRSRSRHGR